MANHPHLPKTTTFPSGHKLTVSTDAARIVIGAAVARAARVMLLLIVVRRTGSVVIVAARIRRGIWNVVGRQLAALARFLRAGVWRENSLGCVKMVRDDDFWGNQADGYCIYIYMVEDIFGCWW